MPEDLGERSESPTSKRLSEARQRGQIARSQDLSSALLLFGAAAMVAALGGPLMSGMGSMMRQYLEEGLADPVTGHVAARDALVEAAMRGVVIVGPLLAVLLLAAYLAHFVQIGWLLTAKPLNPNWGRLDVIKGLGKLFARRNWVKGATNVAKLIVVGAITFAVVRSDLLKVLGLPRLTAALAMMETGALVLELILWLLLVLAILGIIDYAYQRWQHHHDLRMTKQEVKDERRSSEGDPEVKARRMRVARQIAMQRLRTDVPKADVVVTNPTHFSVALRYDAAEMAAPKVVAKGADYMALQIRLIASSHGVPIIERPALARALYHGVDVGREIPAEQYEAVAEVLAYVYRLEGRAAS